MGTHFSFLFSIYSENHGVQAEQLNFSRSSDITYVQYKKLGRYLSSEDALIKNLYMTNNVVSAYE